MWFQACGVDMIADKLIEMNVTSVGGFAIAEQLYGINLAKHYLTAIMNDENFSC